MRSQFRFFLIFTIFVGSYSFAADVPKEVTNTQEETHPLLSPEDALSRLQLPPGFRATVFASEPEIRQPIGMAFDSRGRLWIAENDTYSDSSIGYDLNQHDRVLIFEDADQDGKAETRKVFWDQGQYLTSVETGFGGVWVLCAPDLLFIPDRDRNDIPDGEPEVMLTGFDKDSIRHNIVNGLKWGPDGWLYGRHGITTTSFVGTPETPEELRVPLNCSMWRFHPVTHQFEVISNGTTNSWGHDWDEHGNLLFINTVIGHLWHVIPGVHLERMFGEDFNPHLYKLMPQAADHFHWDQAEKWSDIRKTGVTTTTDSVGGGHAHCGMMIYQGTNWPKEYRGDVLTLNLHGRRINRDHLERFEAGIVGKHRSDFARSEDLWFRGVELGHGPDGGVYILDWSDIGECHENDGIHRTSGRIYKIVYGDPQRTEFGDYHALSDELLLAALESEDAWHSRMAQRTLQEQFVAGRNLSMVRSQLIPKVLADTKLTTRLHALWTLHVTGGTDSSLLKQLLESDQEMLRVWAVQLLSQQSNPERHSMLFARLAENETSGLVLMHVASALQRFPLSDRLEVGRRLLQHGEFFNDRHLPLMVWYAIEPAVAAQPQEWIDVLSTCRIPEIQRFIARRITSDYRQQTAAIAALVQLASESDRSVTKEILSGMKDALNGWRRADAPTGWNAASKMISGRDDSELKQLVQELAVTFGDGRAIDELRKLSQDGNATVAARRNAVRALVTAKDKESQPILVKLLGDRELAIDAIRGLAVIGNETTPQLIIERYNGFRGHIKPVAMESLTSRSSYAVALLQAVLDGKIPASEVPPFYVRQLRSFDDAGLQQLLKETYPEWRHTSKEKEARANELRQLLTSEKLAQANASQGRALFEKTCASCHKLYGSGGKLGPDLTGSQRSNLNYLLGNIVDPSAEVAEKFRMSIIALKDGRVVSGVVQQESDETLVVMTPNEELTILKEDIDVRQNSNLSMMPERQLDKMTDKEILDLFAYLMSKQQVPVASSLK